MVFWQRTKTMGFQRLTEPPVINFWVPNLCMNLWNNPQFAAANILFNGDPKQTSNMSADWNGIERDPQFFGFSLEWNRKGSTVFQFHKDQCLKVAKILCPWCKHIQPVMSPAFFPTSYSQHSSSTRSSHLKQNKHFCCTDMDMDRTSTQRLQMQISAHFEANLHLHCRPSRLLLPLWGNGPFTRTFQKCQKVQ